MLHQETLVMCDVILFTIENEPLIIHPAYAGIICPGGPVPRVVLYGGWYQQEDNFFSILFLTSSMAFHYRAVLINGAAVRKVCSTNQMLAA